MRSYNTSKLGLLSRAAILAGLAGVLVVIVEVTPKLEGLFALHQGASLLEMYSEYKDHELLARAIVHLQKAVKRLPDEPLAWRYLARAYRLKGRLDLVLMTLEQAYKLDSKSLLVKRELMLAYRDLDRPNILLEEELAFSLDRLNESAKRALAEKRYEEALRWYDYIFEYWPEYRSQINFCRLLVVIELSDQRTFEFLEKAEENNYELFVVNENSVMIPGAALRGSHRECGRQLAYTREDGVFWTSDRGSIIIKPEYSAIYQVRITVRHSNPPPVEMAFGVNGQQLKFVSLDKGDDSWTTITFVAHISPPVASIDVWFLNDIWIEGVVDRNAFVRQIELIKLHPVDNRI